MHLALKDRSIYKELVWKMINIFNVMTFGNTAVRKCQKRRGLFDNREEIIEGGRV